ncbi:MAG: ABC transporter permease [Christensenellales bacterium]|jgi:ABC-type proline/glycine betaine transport system permease subunit
MDFFRQMPLTFDIDLAAIDRAIKSFAVQYDAFFSGISGFIRAMIQLLQRALNWTPWWALVLLVALIGWRRSGRVFTGVLYGALLYLVGAVGYWAEMNATLAIVIASVLLSVALGFPLGVLMSINDRIANAIRPVLDTMQTMPIFVYLIPSVMFFGIGAPPAVLATTIYSIVPMVRMTSLGIRQVDREVVEASRAFGATYWQTLFLVQVPQAIPTIMSGLNQTIMMAMAMVVTCSMIGAGGLGYEVLTGVNRIEVGRGLVSGTAVVIVAILLDRLTQRWTKQSEEKALKGGA